jgi:hypothetical protein
LKPQAKGSILGSGDEWPESILTEVGAEKIRRENTERPRTEKPCFERFKAGLFHWYLYLKISNTKSQFSNYLTVSIWLFRLRSTAGDLYSNPFFEFRASNF